MGHQGRMHGRLRRNKNEVRKQMKELATAQDIMSILLIDNRLRDPADSAFDFRVDLSDASTPYAGVISAELMQLQMQRIAKSAYFVVSIEPLDKAVECGGGMDTAFAVCSYSNDDYDLINTMVGDNISGRSEFSPPLSRLNVLRVKIKGFDGHVLRQEDFRNPDGTLRPAYDRVMLCIAFSRKNCQLP
jgi:hypothetical protein